jgi:hypothetical protein
VGAASGEKDYSTEDILKALDFVEKEINEVNEVMEGHGDFCWGLVLKCYELRTRQHKMLNINALRPLKHYLP